MHGARMTRTFAPSLPGSSARSFSAPAMAHDKFSHTRTVTAGGVGEIKEILEADIPAPAEVVAPLVQISVR